jgi:hypothetical protein
VATARAGRVTDPPRDLNPQTLFLGLKKYSLYEFTVGNMSNVIWGSTGEYSPRRSRGGCYLGNRARRSPTWKDRVICVVSHDRAFLDDACTDVLHISGHARRLTQERGNYSTARALSGHLSGLSFAVVTILPMTYGFVWARRALNSQKRWLPARAVGKPSGRSAGN